LSNLLPRCEECPLSVLVLLSDASSIIRKIEDDQGNVWSPLHGAAPLAD
jgi:hypothetical protein